MRLTCDCETVNRLLPSFNMRGKNKPVRCQLSVGRKPGSDKEGHIFLMICSKVDRNGTKYKLKGNVEKFFTRFMDEGKATIRLVEPPHDICISKADTVPLRGFLSVVRLGHQGSDSELDKITLSSLAPACSKQVENLTKKMTITKRKDYPITTGFRSSLVTLQVCGCNLKRLDSRMLKLRNLTVLNLSNNVLQSLPDDLGTLTSLSELHLADNQLTQIPQRFCTGTLSASLTLLDLTKNKIKFFRPYFCQLTNLVTLKLDDNELVCLPAGLGKLRRLRLLSATKNQLCTLPASFTQLQLDDLDLFGNAFMEDGPASARDKLQDILPLQEITARYIRMKRITYEKEDIPSHLHDYLESYKPCLCGGFSFHSFVHYLSRLDLHRVAATVTGIDKTGRTFAPAEAFLCSRHCFERYRKNPYATFWK